MTGMPYRIAMLLGALLLLTLVATRAAEGEVPTAADFAACNAEAPQTVRAGAASPIGGDHARADHARHGTIATSVPRSPGTGVDSPDPQIHGMEAEGARNATYQAAYRSCMRRKGF